jgi:hypothetical protein
MLMILMNLFADFEDVSLATGAGLVVVTYRGDW